MFETSTSLMRPVELGSCKLTYKRLWRRTFKSGDDQSKPFQKLVQINNEIPKAFLRTDAVEHIFEKSTLMYRSHMTRRSLLAGAAAAPFAARISANTVLPSGRPVPSRRKFTSPAVEQQLADVKNQIKDPELAWMFENCYPNTLDTTVHFRKKNGVPDTFVITGDIDAMWLRDSSAQVWPYLPLAKNDSALRQMLEGLIRRQTQCILLDPYANAFMLDPTSPPLSWAVHDITERHPGVGERKWEMDSLCYPIRLAYGYWKNTGDTSPFDADWHKAMRLIIQTFRDQQRRNSPGPYKFERLSDNPTETLSLGGYGNPTRKVGLIHSMFRPSEDACLYPLFIPANLFALTALGWLREMSVQVAKDPVLGLDCVVFASEIQQALDQFAHIATPEGDVWAYEVDGYGNQLFMDDANAPGLLSLAYLGCCAVDDPLYQRTRAWAWSMNNPYFFRGTAAEGIGGPHEGLRMIWPMSLIMRALTSTNDHEISTALEVLKKTHVGTGFIHQSFDQDNPKHFTRGWFASANSLFGELIIKVSQTRPHLL
jgi:meiotically up-regulated gene 157 (Mug157) protein